MKVRQAAPDAGEAQRKSRRNDQGDKEAFTAVRAAPGTACVGMTPGDRAMRGLPIVFSN